MALANGLPGLRISRTVGDTLVVVTVVAVPLAMLVAAHVVVSLSAVVIGPRARCVTADLRVVICDLLKFGRTIRPRESDSPRNARS